MPDPSAFSAEGPSANTDSAYPSPPSPAAGPDERKERLSSTRPPQGADHDSESSQSCVFADTDGTSDEDGSAESEPGNVTRSVTGNSSGTDGSFTVDTHTSSTEETDLPAPELASPSLVSGRATEPGEPRMLKQARVIKGRGIPRGSMYADDQQVVPHEEYGRNVRAPKKSKAVVRPRSAGQQRSADLSRLYDPDASETHDRDAIVVAQSTSPNGARAVTTLKHAGGRRIKCATGSVRMAQAVEVAEIGKSCLESMDLSVVPNEDEDIREHTIDDLKTFYKRICREEQAIKLTRRDDNDDLGVIQLQFARWLRLAKLYALVMEANYLLGHKYDLESRLWKNAVYPAIEHLRRRLHKPNSEVSAEYRTIWLDFLDRIKDLYRSLIVTFKSQWNDLKHRQPRIGSPIWHRSLNCLGDLARYRTLYADGHPAQALSQRDWSEATRLYKEASFLSPSNGLYYNQLAIVASYQDLHLEVLYYYLRSLTVQVPFSSAKESLLAFFDLNQRRLLALEGGSVSGRPSSRASKRPLSLDKLMDPKQAETKAHGRLIRLHEMFFTRISSEQFTCVYSSLVKSTQWDKESLSDDTHFWLCLAISQVCMTVVGNFQDGPDHFKEDLLTLSMHGMNAAISRQMALIHEQYDAESKLKQGATAGPAVYIEIQLLWLLTSGTDWVSMLSLPKYRRTWSSFAAMCNGIITACAVSPASELRAVAEIMAEGRLPEDWELRGLTPFQQVTKEHQSFREITAGDVDTIDAFLQTYWDDRNTVLVAPTMNGNTARVRRILELSRALCQYLPSLQYDEAQHRFIFGRAHPSCDAASDDGHPPVTDNDQESDVETLEYESQLEVIPADDPSVELDENFLHLKIRREQLHDKLQSKPLPDRKHARRKLVPGETVIVFDTNVYLSRLDAVIQIIESGSWHVTVPLVVITELDGLTNSKGHNVEEAVRAVSYLEKQFAVRQPMAHRKPWLKLQTSAGNFLPELLIRTEDFSTRKRGEEWRKNNDDVILKCCLHYRKESGEACPVLLVTEDVNLKLKARAMDMDVGHVKWNGKRAMLSLDS
ncbi:Smg-6, nonsense mediated mRNA decay factor [Gaertneriomyces sp. JEL0708]|nr:Smg-6, nonsense mediated mRNA decay factor [Gaertneriomyces sp. JEL0708]